jgi:AcrR family transcriptional regulator
VVRSASAPGRDEASETAARILDAAVAVFSRYGFRRASVDDVAREAGVAKGTIYLYHESKEELFRAVTQVVADRLLAGAGEARAAKAPAAEKLRLLLEAKFLYLFDVVTRSPHAAELLDSKGRLAADVFETADRKYHALIGAVISEGVESGQVDLSRAGLSPAAAAAFLVRVGHGLETPDAAGSVPSREVYRRRIAELVRVVLAGLGPR